MTRHADPYDGPEIRGVDLSFWQGDKVDFDALKAADYGYVFARIATSSPVIA